MTEPAGNLSFEQAYQRLGTLIEELETKPLPLDAAIDRYEEGVRLAQLCNEILEKAELRISSILRETNGSPGAG